MALKGRSELENLTGTNLASNNSKQITATKHRKVVESLIESKFNLKEDTLKQLNYEAGKTLEQYLGGLLREVIKRGSFYGLDVGGGSIGSTYSTNGIVSNAICTATSGKDTLVRVNFSESIENKVVIPIVHFQSPDYNVNNDICCPVMKVINSTKIDIGFREVSGGTQNLKIEFIVM